MSLYLDSSRGGVGVSCHAGGASRSPNHRWHCCPFGSERLAALRATRALTFQSVGDADVTVFTSIPSGSWFVRMVCCCCVALSLFWRLVAGQDVHLPEPAREVQEAPWPRVLHGEAVGFSVALTVMSVRRVDGKSSQQGLERFIFAICSF